MHCTFNKVRNALRFNKRVKRPLRLWLLMTPRPTIRENEINSPRFSGLYLSLFMHLPIPRGRQAKSLFDSAKKDNHKSEINQSKECVKTNRTPVPPPMSAGGSDIAKQRLLRRIPLSGSFKTLLVFLNNGRADLRAALTTFGETFVWRSFSRLC